jgi:hypothetical protein
MNLILDVDEVILEWHAAFLEWTALSGLKLDPAGPSSWDLTDWAGPEALSLVRQFNTSSSFAQIPFTTGTLEFLEEYQRLGSPYPIKLLTSCGVEEATLNARRRNLSAIESFVSECHFLPLGASKKDQLTSYLPNRVNLSRRQRKPRARCSRPRAYRFRL